MNYIIHVTDKINIACKQIENYESLIEKINFARKHIE